MGHGGQAHEIVYTTPNYLQTAHIVASSELVAVLPSRLARYFASLLPLQLHGLPFELGPFHLDVASLGLRQRDAALQWLIEQIAMLGESRFWACGAGLSRPSEPALREVSCDCLMTLESPFQRPPGIFNGWQARRAECV